MNLAEAIYKLSENLPDVEKFGLYSQIRRSAISVPSNIAEGAGRSGDKEFHHFLSMALGSLNETYTQYLLIKRLYKDLIDDEKSSYIETTFNSLGRQINSLMSVVNRSQLKAKLQKRSA